MEKELTVSNKKQLVDLNGDNVNFQVEVKVVPKSKGVYQAALVRQTDLDQGNIQYQTFDKQFSARVENTDNIYQNHFLCLKSDTELPVTVTIDRKELGRIEPEIFEPPPPLPVITPPTSTDPGLFTTKNIIILVIVIGICVGIYIMWSENKEVSEICPTSVSIKNNNNSTGGPTATISTSTPIPAPAPIIAPISAPVLKVSSPDHSDLLAKLSGLVAD